MGFYLELRRLSNEDGYGETEIPVAFWALYAFAGFALSCMGLAAWTVMGDLAAKGSDLDRFFLFTISLSVPFYILVGLKMAFVRKRVLFSNGTLVVGFTFAGKFFWRTKIQKDSVAEFVLENKRKTPNLAPGQHADAQYYIRGHWRLLLLKKDGRTLVVDKHTEKEALEPLYRELVTWKAI